MPKKNKANTNKACFSASPALIISIAVLVIAVVVIAIAAVHLIGGNAVSSTSSLSQPSDQSEQTIEQTSLVDFNDAYSYVQIEMQDGGIIVLELYPEAAPITVANFMELVESGFYDGLIFHRISSGFVIQGGDPLGTGVGGSDKTIFGEFSVNGFENPLAHTRGVISMARSQNDYNSASSQFFICLDDRTAVSLDGSYAAFGRVVSGMEVVDAIASVATYQEKPLQDVVMKRLTILHTAGENAVAKANGS